MIRKIGESYKITEVRQERTRYFTLRLKKSEWRTLKVDHDFFTRRTCVSCGMYERPDVYSVQAFPEKLWICDDCAAKFCPELLSEAERLRDEHYTRLTGLSKKERDRGRKPSTWAQIFGDKPNGKELAGQPEMKKCSPTEGETDDEVRMRQGRY